MLWPKFLIEKSNENYYNCKHECDDLSKPSKIAKKYVVASIPYQLNK